MSDSHAHNNADVVVNEEGPENLDYASKVRSDLVARHRQGIKLLGIEVRT